MSDSSRILLGAMSGTSADGVDVAAVEITGRGLGMQAKYLAHVEHPYEAELRRQIFEVRESGSCSLEELAKLGREITLAYATAVRELLAKMSLDPQRMAGLAAHGQTLYHAPPDSIQWLDPSLLAAETDLAVISDFRRADLAAGGQGAPLVPFGDWILFRHPEKTRVILNIGGIANLTYLPAGGGIEDVIAFDTGPGMCISDWLMRTHDPDGPGFDEGGRIAMSGKGDFSGARAIARDRERYWAKTPPKSLDIGEAISQFERSKLVWGDEEPPLKDRLVTACMATAVSVHAAAWNFLPGFKGQDEQWEWLISGGGTRNARLIEHLRVMLESHAVKALTATLPSQAREAVCFAILGAATLDGEPSSVPSATGARRRVVLGSVTPRPAL